MKKLTKGTVLLFAVLLASIMLFSGCPTPFDLGDATQINKELTVVAGGDISIDAFSSDVSVGVSPDNKVHLTYYEYERVTYEFMENEDGFSIEQEINGSNSGKIKDMTVLVPTGLILGAFSTETLSGDINITGVSANSVGVSANSVDVSSISGNIRVNQLSSNGVSIKTTSGNISGSIKESRNDFIVSSSSGSGRVTIEGGNNGGNGTKTLTVNTISGNISITFTE